MSFSRTSLRLASRQLRASMPSASYIPVSSFFPAKTQVTILGTNQNINCHNIRQYSTEGGARDVQKEISDLVVKSKVVVFMKGVPDAPRCGFSNAVVQIMRMHDVTYEAHNVLEDEGIREGIKEFSSWPTIPQIYMEGEFVGGCDILLQMHQSGELVEELNKVGIKSALLTPEDDKKE